MAKFDIKRWLIRENLSLLGRPLRFSTAAPPAQPSSYLTFSSAEPFTIGVYNAEKNWNGTLYYSTDAATWNEWDGTTAIVSADRCGEQRIYLRGSNNTQITKHSYNLAMFVKKYNWVLTGSDIRCVGNIENLLDYKTVANGEHPTMSIACFYMLFYGCTSLITAPNLPATNLSESCYTAMFHGCTGLVKAPDLPATNLGRFCYDRMFYGCTSLVTVPALPATTLTVHCYYKMFYNCISLVTVPALPALVLPQECYSNMFYGCTGLKISATQSEEYPNEYRIPVSGTVAEENVGLLALSQMFYKTSGTAYHTPSVNKTYYTANEVVPAGKIVGYSYNGVVLPDVRGAWDSLIESVSAFKMSYGLFVYDPEKNLGVRFIATSCPWRFDGANVYSAHSGADWTNFEELKYMSFEDANGFNWWRGSSGYFVDALYLTPDDVFWTSHDILNGDGTVFMAASEPIPVYE